jgi:hypothetical protein
VELSVGASGYRALSYQWKKGGETLGGETGVMLRRNGVSASEGGMYRVVVSNADGAEESQEVEVRVMRWEELAGVYQGLLKRSGVGELAEEFYGRVTATVNRAGMMSVSLQIQGQTVRISGKWQRELTFEREVRVNSGSSVRVRMKLDGFEKRVSVSAESSGGEVMSGGGELWLVDGGSAGSGKYVSKRYTMLWELSGGGAGVPKAPGYASVLVTRSGMASVVGKLGDGTAVSAAAYMTRVGRMPLYAGVYGTLVSNAGYVGSVVEFGEDAAVGVRALGALTWKRPVRLVGGVEVAAFVGGGVLEGNQFEGMGGASGEGELMEVRVMGEGGGNGLVRWRVRQGEKGTVGVVGLNEERMQMEVNGATGVVSGRFTDWGSGKVSRFWGVVMPRVGRGGGVLVDGEGVHGWRLSEPSAGGAE